VVARALLADPAVLILDERTAHLDEATADHLVRDLSRATEGRTTLLITHRHRDLEAVDQVVDLTPPCPSAIGPFGSAGERPGLVSW